MSVPAGHNPKTCVCPDCTAFRGLSRRERKREVALASDKSPKGPTSQSQPSAPRPSTPGKGCAVVLGLIFIASSISIALDHFDIVDLDPSDPPGSASAPREDETEADTTSRPTAPVRSDSPDELVVTAACDQSFSVAASVDPMSDTVEDLNPALDACKSVEEWVMAARRHPAAIQADPRLFLNNRCDFGGRAVKESFLCQVLAGKREAIFATAVGVAPDTHPFIEGEVMKFEPLDEANLRVFLRLTNSGTEAAKGECSITAHDASSSIVGFDVYASRDEIKPRGSLILRGTIRIEDEGAFRVRRVRATDCAASS